MPRIHCRVDENQRLTVGLCGHVRGWAKYGNFDSSVGVGDIDEQRLVIIVRSLGRYGEVDSERWRTVHSDVEVEQRPVGITGITYNDPKRTCSKYTTPSKVSK